MITYLKAKGYKLTVNETLNNRQFREVSQTIELNEELSTLDTVAYNNIKTYELFLDMKTFSEDKIKTILGDLRGEAQVITGTATIEKQERGYLITLLFNIGE